MEIAQKYGMAIFTLVMIARTIGFAISFYLYCAIMSSPFWLMYASHARSDDVIDLFIFWAYAIGSLSIIVHFLLWLIVLFHLPLPTSAKGSR